VSAAKTAVLTKLVPLFVNLCNAQTASPIADSPYPKHYIMWGLDKLTRYIDPIFGGTFQLNIVSDTLTKLTAPKEYHSETLFSGKKGNGGNPKAVIGADANQQVLDGYNKLDPEQQLGYLWMWMNDTKNVHIPRLHGRQPSHPTKESLAHWSNSPWHRLYILAEWCKTKDGYVPCSKDVRTQNTNRNGLFAGDESTIPWIRFTIRRLDAAQKPECVAEMYWHMLMCRTCCCRNGFIMTGKDLILTNAKGGEICGTWFKWVDIFSSFVVGVLRTSQATGWGYDNKCVKWS